MITQMTKKIILLPEITIVGFPVFGSSNILPIYFSERFFSRLLSASICFDMMPNESAGYIFSERHGKLAGLYDIVMENVKQMGL